MKRPLAVIGFTFLAALIFASFSGFGACAAVGGFLLLCSVVILFVFKPFQYKTVLVTVLISAFFACLWYCLAWHFWYEPAAVLDGAQATVTGTVWDEPQQSGGQYVYNIKSESFVCGAKVIPLKTTVRLRSKDPLGLNAFDRVKIEVQLSLPVNGEGGFDTKTYYRSKGVYLFAEPVNTAPQNDESASDAVKSVSAGKLPLYAYAVNLREFISSVLHHSVTGENGALSAGILIGDTSGLPEQVKEDFTVCGISHILAVSGTQTSLICQYLLLALSACRLKRRPRALITMAAIVLFMAVTGFSSSVMRAGIMSLLYLSSMLFGRETDTLNSLGFSVLALCLFNPFAATDTGLLLSFTATLGMILFSGRFAEAVEQKIVKLPERLQKSFRAPTEILGQTLGASIFTYPILLLTFRKISTVALFTNLVEVPLSLFITLASTIIVLLTPLKLFGFLIAPMAMLIRLAAAFMIWFAHVFASIPFASLSTDYGFVMIFFCFTVLALAIYLFSRHRGGDFKVTAACVCLTFSVGLFSYFVSARGVMQIAALPVTYGSCTVVSKDGHAFAVDLSGSSSEYELEQFLKNHNIAQLDALILSGYDIERVENANELLISGKVRNVIVPGYYSTDKGYRAVYLKTPSTLKLWGDTSVEIIPSKDAKRLLSIIHYGSGGALLTGNESLSLNDYPFEADKLQTDTILFGGSLPNELLKSKKTRYAIAGDNSASAYPAAALQTSGCKVAFAQNGGQSILTRGNGQYLMK